MEHVLGAFTCYMFLFAANLLYESSALQRLGEFAVNDNNHILQFVLKK